MGVRVWFKLRRILDGATAGPGNVEQEAYRQRDEIERLEFEHLFRQLPPVA